MRPVGLNAQAQRMMHARSGPNNVRQAHMLPWRFDPDLDFDVDPAGGFTARRARVLQSYFRFHIHSSIVMHFTFVPYSSFHLPCLRPSSRPSSRWGALLLIVTGFLTARSAEAPPLLPRARRPPASRSAPPPAPGPGSRSARPAPATQMA